MCGLVSAAVKQGTLTPLQKRLFLTLAMSEMDTRGGDSWSHILVSNNNPTPTITRGQGASGGNMLYTDALLEHWDLMIGHTRKTTHGTKTDPDPHPFINNNDDQSHGVVLVHNGILSCHTELNTKYSREFDVDSEHLAQHLASRLPLNDITGYGAILWLDTDDIVKGQYSQIRAVRWDGGELSVWGIGTGIDDCQGVLVMSTGRSMLAIAHSLGLNVFEYARLDDRQVYQLTPSGLFSSGEKLDIGQRFYSAARQPYITPQAGASKVLDEDDIDDVIWEYEGSKGTKDWCSLCYKDLDVSWRYMGKKRVCTPCREELLSDEPKKFADSLINKCTKCTVPLTTSYGTYSGKNYCLTCYGEVRSERKIYAL